jgi:hypothetical protein
VQSHIIGMDFLQYFKLSVDAESKQVFISKTGQQLGCTAGVAAQVSALSSAATTLSSGTAAQEVKKLLARYPGLHSTSLTRPAPKHGIMHSIETTGRPVFAKARRLDPEKLRIAKEEFRQLEAAFCFYVGILT